MKQILHDFASGKVIVADVPCPAVTAQGVLVRNLFSAVSPGTERASVSARSRNVVRTALKRKDLVRRVLAKAKRDGFLATARAVRRKLGASLPLGYSSAGRVIEVGEDVSEIRPGDLVACAGAGYAGHAEYVCVPQMLCVKVPENVEAGAAAFTTLGAIAMQGIRQADPRIGETVAVMGLGIMGQLTAQTVEAAGAQCIGMDTDLARVEMFRNPCRGAGVQVDADAEQKVLDMTEGRGADRVIVTAASHSNSVIELAAAICRDRGRIVVVGDVPMQVPRPPFYEKELELKLSRSYGPGRYDPTYEVGGIDYPMGYVRWTENRNMQEFLRLVRAGAVTPLAFVTDRFPVERAPEAYGEPGEGRVRPLGVLIEYPAREEAVPSHRVSLRTRRLTTGDVGVAVLGAGNFARSVVMPTLAKTPNVRLAGVASARGVNARDLATKYNCAFCASDIEELINADSVDAVFITTPHNLHAEQALRALAAGKSVYLEKPLCIREEDVDRVVGAAHASEGCFFVGYNRRFSPMGEMMRDAFAGRTGPLTMHYRVNAGKIPPGSWVVDPEIGGGRIVGEVCHFVDFARFVVGRGVCDVTACGTGETRDDVTATVRFEDGSVATISYVTSGPDAYSKEHIEVIGAGKACVIDDFRRWMLHDGRRTREKTCAQDKGHGAAFREFIDCVRGEAEMPFTIDELAETSRVTFRICKMA